MEPMEPMRVLPVYSYRPIVLNRFDLLHHLLLLSSCSRACRALALLLTVASSAGPLAMPRTIREKYGRREREKDDEDDDEEEEEVEEESIEQDREGNFIARANQTREKRGRRGSI